MTCVAIRPGDSRPKNPIAMASWWSAIAPLRIAMASMMLRKSLAAFSVLALTHASQICALRSACGLIMWTHRQLAAFGGRDIAGCASHRAGIDLASAHEAINASG